MGLTYEEVQARVQAGGGSDDPENPKYLLGSKDRKMRQTLRNINEGVPADPLTWSGKPMEAGTGALLEESAGTAAPKPLSFEEVQARLGTKPAASGAQAMLQQGGEVVKSTLTNLAGIADMVLSVPGMVLSAGADLGTRINEFADPLLRGYEGASRKEVGQKALAAGQSLAEPFMNPLHKLMKAFGYGEAYDASDVQQAMSMISKGIQSGGDWVEKQTKGLLTTEDVQSLANAAMAGAGAWGTAKGVQPKVDAIGKAKPTDLPGAARTAEAAKKLREEDYASPQDFTADVERSAQGEALNTIDAMRNAEQRAYELMQGEAWKEQGGVPKKQVEAIRKHNPLVGEALDRMMERRRLAIEGFKETRQGEWLPPEEPAAAMATPRGPGITEPSGVPGLKELPTLDQRLLEDLSSRFKDDLQSGQADPRLLAVLAATGLTAAAFMQLDPKDREDAKVLGLAAAMLPVGGGLSSLSTALRKAGNYSSTILERLPQDRHTFTKKQVWEQVARADVSQAEKDAFKYILRNHKGDTIKAQELVEGFYQDTADLRLERVETRQLAEWGLDHIDRQELNEYGEPLPVHSATSTIYRLPYEVSRNNHFDDIKYYGHTRSFLDELGERRVIEVQSDLLQKLRPLSEAEKVEIPVKISEAIQQRKDLRKLLDELFAEPGQPWDLQKISDRLPAELVKTFYEGYARELEALQSRSSKLSSALGAADHRVAAKRALGGISEDLSLRVAELRQRLKAPDALQVERLGPITKYWPQRLIREELARAPADTQAARERLQKLVDKQREVFAVMEQAKNSGRNVQEVLNDNARTGKGPYGDGSGYLDLAEQLPKDIKQAIRESRLDRKVHFATADTVAKVEGWPEPRTQIEARLQELRDQLKGRERGIMGGSGLRPEVEIPRIKDLIAHEESRLQNLTGRFKPEHQSIYDRYLKDIEPYLKKLGGVETKDSAGHTWISVPVKPEHGRVPTFGQAGQIDPRLLARMAAIGLGVTLGMWASDRDHKWTGAALGAMVGFGLGRSPAKLVQTWKGLWAKDTRFRIDDLTNAWEFAQDKAAKLAWDLQRSVEKLVPEDAGRVRITQWLDDPSSIQLRGAELRAAQMVKAWFDGMKVAATNAGVLKTAVDNYVTHLWDWKAGRAQSPILQAFYDRLEGRGAGMSPHSPYTKERTFSTLAEGKKAGLTPLTEDISAIIGIYSNSMSRAMANKALLDGLKKGKMPNGMGLVIPADKAPHYYARIDSPQMAGVAVHPDIAPSLNFLFSKAPRGALPAVLEMVNTAIKRSQVSFSLFHVKALIDAGLAGTSHPLDFIAKLPEYFSGRTDLLKQLRQQGLTPMIELAYKSGLKFGLEKGKLAVEDVGMDSFYAGLKSLQVGLDSAFKGLGKPVEGLAKVNHAFDKFMWDWVHTGMKLDIFAEKVEALIESSVQRHAKDPNIPVLTKEQAGAIAASYTNDLLGGLNWRRIAEGAQTKWGRNLALQIYSKQGRWWMQLALFAPDWTLSTTRAMAQAFGKGSGPIKGLLRPTTLADLHRQYIARAAAIYFVVGNTLNQALTGKWLWENDDWTTIDMGDGRKMQWSKHTMEPVHWMQKPGQQGLNKMGILPKEGLEQLLNVDYLSTKGNMRPMEGDRVAHAAKKLLPISVASSFDAGAEAGLLGFAGIPIHGRSDTQRANDRLRRRLEKLDRLGEK